VQDGFIFSLRASFARQTIKANGYVKRPVNFQEGHARLTAFLSRLAQNDKPDQGT
jgi:DNA-binding response OmpR family regulator